jgi:murein DD-endopeptidase MepM/ murein hydrolase activator NlpD
MRPLVRLSVLLVTASLVGAAAAEPAPLFDAVAVTEPKTPADELTQHIWALGRKQRDIKQEMQRDGDAAAAALNRAVSTGRAYARLARVGLLPLGGGFDELVNHAARVERLRRSIERDLTAHQRLSQRRAEMQRAQQTLEGQQQAAEVERRAIASAREALLSARERELAFERAFSGSRSPYTAVYGAVAGPTDPSDLTEGFGKLKGRLPFPLPGRTEIWAATRRGGGPGLEMRAPEGSPVRAVYPGRVAFADSYADYGKSVIIDHGEQYFTVSSNLGSIDVAAGDTVSTGTKVGTLGPDGQQGMLYFEIRVGAETVEPAPWFGI